MYGLAADGKTNRLGMPNPLRLAVIAEHHLDTVALPVVPVSLQRAALAVGAPIGRMLGYRADLHPQARDRHASAPAAHRAGRRLGGTMKRAFWIALIAVVLLVLAAAGMVARGVHRTRPSATRASDPTGRCGYPHRRTPARPIAPRSAPVRVSE